MACEEKGTVIHKDLDTKEDVVVKEYMVEDEDEDEDELGVVESLSKADVRRARSGTPMPPSTPKLCQVLQLPRI